MRRGYTASRATIYATICPPINARDLGRRISGYQGAYTGKIPASARYPDILKASPRISRLPIVVLERGGVVSAAMRLNCGVETSCTRPPLMGSADGPGASTVSDLPLEGYVSLEYSSRVTEMA
jgi:hypothetical protein